MIVEPARMAGLQFEHDERTGRTLDQSILEDAARDPSALPLVQYALAELYDERDLSQGMLTFAAYEKMGGVEGAIGQRAAAVFGQLPESSRAALVEILPLLVTVDIEGDQNAVRRWDALTHWVQTNRNDLRLRSRIEQSQQRWEQEKREPSLLLSPGLPLEEGRQLLKAAPTFLTSGSNEYINASITHNEAVVRHQTRRRQIVLTALSCLTILAIAGGLFAWIQREKAESQRKKAQAAESIAEASNAKATEQQSLAITRLTALTEQAKEASKALFAYGVNEYEAGRFESAIVKLLRARALRIFDAPIKQSYEAVITDRMTRGNRSWLELHHREWVRCITFSPDGSRVATASYDSTARLWDAQTGAPLGSPMEHDAPVYCITFSPDGSRVATGSFDFTARLWDAQTGARLGEQMKHGDLVTCFSFSSDGSRIATASHDGMARLWDVRTILPKDMNAFLNRFAEKPDPTIRRDLEFEEELKTYITRKQFLYRSFTAVHSVTQKDWFAAKFHLPWLIEQEPNNPRWKQLLDEVNAVQVP